MAMRTVIALMFVTPTAGCTCGSFEAYLPQYDRDYSGWEQCGAGRGASGIVDVVETNDFHLWIWPHVRGLWERQNEVDNMALFVTLPRNEMVAGAELHPDPENTASSGGIGFQQAEVHVLDIEEVEHETSTGYVTHTLRADLDWDVTWGEEGSGGLWVHSEGSDWVEASLWEGFTTR